MNKKRYQSVGISFVSVVSIKPLYEGGGKKPLRAHNQIHGQLQSKGVKCGARVTIDSAPVYLLDLLDLHMLQADAMRFFYHLKVYFIAWLLLYLNASSLFL